MKTKSFKYGQFYLKSYYKPVGNGWEVGLWWNKKQLFCGNFIHAEEANKWWAHMNKEIRSFTKKYGFTPSTSTGFYTTFFSNYMYKSYYHFLDTLFAKYNKSYSTAALRDMRKYKTYARKSTHKHQDWTYYDLKSA